jgi:hypothetical protein
MVEGADKSADMLFVQISYRCDFRSTHVLFRAIRCERDEQPCGSYYDEGEIGFSSLQILSKNERTNTLRLFLLLWTCLKYAKYR